MRKFIVGAYWGGLLAVAIGLLPIIVFRPRLLPFGSMEDLQQLTPILLLAGFALLPSVLAAGTMVILREIAAVRAALERAGNNANGLPARLSGWAGKAQANGGLVPPHRPAPAGDLGPGPGRWRRAVAGRR